MPTGRLTPLQLCLLELLADVEPAWTLTGGGALVGVYLGHRSTRDLDLFLHGAPKLNEFPRRVTERLAHAGMKVTSLESAPTFVRLQVTDGSESVLVDLVAEPVPGIEVPVERKFGAATILVDTTHEILVNKLCALLGRSELRDLQDVCALLTAGEDLDRALQDAPRKDGGFSPIILADLVRHLPVMEQAEAIGLPDAERDALLACRDALVDRLIAASRPDQEHQSE